ncbi:MAG: FAD-dependent oxidoreductase [Cypionkella sp.]|uniref:NAD(P)/FAD-dependent oxidoreductase n=1 Tax=Cypionkella sp. TaxID=2811411 RepID=UPI002731E39F|nr:FAD-dependent oxidoreductase [Cypionkella sp.]MDP1575223.1 FAD-dependent oxidoreductase [Cypionkella sp.]MDP2051675.1 FAD-dependent oxidoreductase [Cypionkella sp.]
MIPIVIIGSGMAGLACARRLAGAGLAAIVLDKGRGIGGRVATRRVGDLQFDHGAQYVNAHGAGFTAVLHSLGNAVGGWQDGTGRSHSVGVPGMSAIPKALGAGLEIRQNAQVARLVQDGDGWALHLESTTLRAARVVMTVPAPQMAGLLGADHPLVAALAPVRLVPCLTLMAAVTGAASFVIRQDADDPLAWIAQNSAKPGRPQGAATQWVAQAGEAFSQTHLEETPTEITARMLPLLCNRLGVPIDRVSHASAHRWRYARVTQPLGQPFLCSPDATLYLGGDWCIGPRVEAAWTSGTAIADDILARG